MSKFYLGLDIGTDSVGVACTDENYSLLRAKGKDCWVSRLFDEAKTAAERRTKRTARRRLERRKYRIKLLQELFAPVISDKTFFIRLNNSQFLPEDKDSLLTGDGNSLFADENYCDKDFHKEFPTVYHLRKALMSGKKYDLRLYYLAIHHIVKYRGHFLIEGGINDVRDEKRLFTALNETFADYYGEDAICFDESFASFAKEILTGAGGIKDKQKQLISLFGISENVGKDAVKAMCGAAFSPANLFGEAFKGEKSISFKKLKDEEFESLEDAYGDAFAVLAALRKIYEFAVFEKLLSGCADISSAMIKVYEKHGKDLKKLKEFIKNRLVVDSGMFIARFLKARKKRRTM